jgi:hypothetical protein
MRCHLAYAQAQGFPSDSPCPLYIRGVDVNREGTTSVVDLTSRDHATVARIQHEAKEEVLLKAAARP